MFEVGQQVVCIVDGPWVSPMMGTSLTVKEPVRGAIYTIREIVAPPSYLLVGLCLEEIVNPAVDFGQQYGVREPDFDSRGFRPVRKTSIDVFTKILLKTPAPGKVDA